MRRLFLPGMLRNSNCFRQRLRPLFLFSLIEEIQLLGDIECAFFAGLSKQLFCQKVYLLLQGIPFAAQFGLPGIGSFECCEQCIDPFIQL